MSNQTSMPLRQGKMAKDEKGNLVLINNEDKAFAINSDLSKIWFMLDGEMSLDVITNHLSKDAEISKSEIKQVLISAIKKLESANLVTWTNQRSNSSETSETSI